jgi:nucleoside-diphosphate-sugar epimerase
VERIPGKLDRETVTAAAEGADVVFHLAGTTRAPDLAGYRRVNLEATREIGLAARDAGSRLVHVSSLAAAGPAGPESPREESRPPEPICDYGKSKLEGERAIREIRGLRWSIARPCAVYGPRDRDFPLLFRFAARGIFPLMGDGTAAYSFVYVGDLVAALVRLASRDEALEEEFFVSHPEPHSSEELMRLLAGIALTDYRPRRIPMAALWLAMTAGRIGSRLGLDPAIPPSRYRQLKAEGWCCSSAKLARLTGFEAEVPLEEGMLRTWRWYSDGRRELD